MAGTNAKPHPDRKSSSGHEAWLKAKKVRNLNRSKQKWMGKSIKEGGHWERI
jgi:hypothetical protein